MMIGCSDDDVFFKYQKMLVVDFDPPVPILIATPGMMMKKVMANNNNSFFPNTV